eukprot:4055979-Alexandrium_andersonii.AAC.1
MGRRLMATWRHCPLRATAPRAPSRSGLTRGPSAAPASSWPVAHRSLSGARGSGRWSTRRGRPRSGGAVTAPLRLSRPASAGSSSRI